MIPFTATNTVPAVSDNAVATKNRENMKALILFAQEAGGISMVNRVEYTLLDGVRTTESTGLVYVDLFGYDGWVAEANFRAHVKSRSPKRFVATVCHGYDSKHFLNELLHGQVRSACMSKEYDLQNFPDCTKLVEALKKNQEDGRWPPPRYSLAAH